MKSQLRFKFDRDKCLEILKRNTEINSPFNFDALVRNKEFRGSFYDNYYFKISTTAKMRGASGIEITGEMKEIIDGDYKTLILAETSPPIAPYFIVGIIILLFSFVFGVFGFIGSLVFSGVILANTTNSKTGISRLIHIIEDEY